MELQQAYVTGPKLKVGHSVKKATTHTKKKKTKLNNTIAGLLTLCQTNVQLCI